MVFLTLVALKMPFVMLIALKIPFSEKLAVLKVTLRRDENKNIS